MQLRGKNLRDEMQSDQEPLFKRQTTRSIAKPFSEPIAASASMVSSEPLVRTKSDIDISELRKQYADNPQALKALDEHFRGLKTSSETGILGTRTEDTLYSSYFFRKDIVDNFTKNVMAQIPSDKKESHPLSSYKLYNADDILENIGQRGTFKTRSTEQTSQYQSLRKTNMDKLIKYLSSKICDSIGSDYAKTAVERAISLTSRENKFDIIVLSNKNIEAMGLTSDEDEDSEDEDEQEAGGDDYDSEDEDYKPEPDEESGFSFDDIIAYRLSGVVGFIIVELGECKT
jgi:hypothetical protein